MNGTPFPTVLARGMHPSASRKSASKNHAEIVVREVQVKDHARVLAWHMHGLTGWYKQMASGREQGTTPHGDGRGAGCAD